MHMTCLGSTYILNVEAVILGITESSIHGFNDEVTGSLVGEANQKPDFLTSWQICEMHVDIRAQFYQET